jgi:hypothetical protein
MTTGCVVCIKKDTGQFNLLVALCTFGLIQYLSKSDAVLINRVINLGRHMGLIDVGHKM